jgi:BolA-like protein 1
LQPTRLEIINDSHLHAHHKAMQGVASKEVRCITKALFEVAYSGRRTFGMQASTDMTRESNLCSLAITSEAFRSKTLLARQRMVNHLLKDEMARDGGIHALQLKTKTPEEEEKQRQTDATQQ